MMRYQGYSSEEYEYPFFKDFDKEGMKDLFMNYYIEKVRSKRITIPKALTMIYTDDKGVQKICYYMNESNSLSGNVLVDQVRKMFGEIGDILNVVIIAVGKLESYTKSALMDFPSYTFNHFRYEELLYDPFDNNLVPKHILYSEEQTREFFKTNPNVKPNNLPRIFESDVCVKRLNGKSGQIVHIERNHHRTESLVGCSRTIRIIVPDED
uniref:DNA-directed RNA polymerase subunit 5 n=1 Tax=Pithovirus LCPAC406 TaxID=2506599 RepID=A0A481ZEG3_9VIRU|nr:MAG: DNA-directed RNA polymerase subunit 5 [Pithovirus LCPAC406]